MTDKLVLLVDDEIFVTKSLTYLLENNGVRCVSRNFPENLAAIAEAGMPGVVVLDINMPGMDGFQVCKELRSNSKLKDVVVIFLSGRGREDDVTKAFEAGANHYVKKPFSPMELLDKIKELYPTT
ncbi:MAG: response regulator transcription factor [Nitrospinae bacterium]|nr:response regulator transcription factor [Nitrospinota bacterium]